MKKLFLPFTILLLTIFIFSSCSERRKVARKLDNEQFRVERISVGDIVTTDGMPEIFFDRCKINKELCPGIWYHSSGQSVNFYWTLADDGKFITFDKIHDAPEPASTQAQTLAGRYRIIERTGERFVITSTETVGYPGINVIIDMVEFR